MKNGTSDVELNIQSS